MTHACGASTRDGKNISNLALSNEKVLISPPRWSMVCLSLVLGPCAEILWNWAQGLSTKLLTLELSFRIRRGSWFAGLLSKEPREREGGNVFRFPELPSPPSQYVNGEMVPVF